MPAPEKGESESEYVSRLMESAEARRDYPDEKQRAAVAYSMYKEKHKVKNCIQYKPTEKSCISKICSGTCKKSALTNQAQFGVMFKGNHLEPGLVRYDELVNPFTNAVGMTLLLDADGIAAIRSSFTGKPVYNFAHPIEEVKPEDITKGKAVGAVAGNVYNAETGWDDVTYMVWDSEAVKNSLDKNFALSGSYIPSIDGVPGMYHNLPYDAKITGGEYEHLAIVKNPRYENSKISPLQNSKGETMPADKTIVQKIKMLFKIGSVDNSVEVDTASKVKVGEAEVSLADLITAHTALENSKAAEAAVKAITDETVVTLENGKTATVAQLKADYVALKNSAAPAAPAPAPAATPVKNEDDKKEKSDEDKKKEEEEKEKGEKMKAENAIKDAAEAAKKEAFEKLRNSALTADMSANGAVQGPMLASDRLEAGNSL